MTSSPSSTRKICVIIFALFLVSNGEKKSKKTREKLVPFPGYELFTSDELPHDKQVTTLLAKDEPKTFLYKSSMSNASLSIIITACSSPIKCSINFQNNFKDKSHLIKNSTIHDTKIEHLKTDQGIYILHLLASARNTLVHVYVSTEPGGPQALQNAPLKNVLTLFKRQQKKKLTIRWEPSLVDPQGTDYCLVVSKDRHYKTLCSALDDVPEGPKPKMYRRHAEIGALQQKITAWDNNQKRDDKRDVACVGPRTHYTFGNLQQSQKYHFDLFAINNQSKLIYLYGSNTLVFDKRIKPTKLKDNKSSYVNLKKFDGKAVFRYKVGKVGEALKLYIMPCGGAVDVFVLQKKQVLAVKKRLESFGRLVVEKPKPKSRFYIKVVSTNKEELRRMSGVEILATTKPSSGSPLPNMPSEPSVQEYSSLRTCDSVTVGWLASPGQKVAHYCLLIREGKLREAFAYKMPNQCGLENRLKKSADFTAQYCKDFQQENEEVITQKISQLKPGKNYIVQVTVKKPKGKTLSYDLLQVQTKVKCDSENKKLF